MKYLVTILGVFLSANLLAQVSAPRFSRGNHDTRVLQSILSHQNSNNLAAARTTSVQRKRVVAQSTRDSLLAQVDSTKLGYSGTLGSNFDYNYLFYNYSYAYNYTPVFNCFGIETAPMVRYDTCNRYQVNPFTLRYGHYDDRYATYDANRNQIRFSELYVDSATNKNKTHYNAFNTQRQIISGKTFVRQSTTYDSAFIQSYSYNTSNKITSDSMYEKYSHGWDLVSVSAYTYDVHNNLSVIMCYVNDTDTSFSHVRQHISRYSCGYDTLNRLINVSFALWDGMLFHDIQRDTFEYQGALTYFSKWRETLFDTVNHYYTPWFNMEKNIATNNLPDSVRTFGWDSLANRWTPTSQYLIKYDTALNPDSMLQWDYSYGYWPTSPSFSTKFYYENYIDNSLVGNVSKEGVILKVYPNPTNGTLHIELPEAEGVLSYFVIDMAGKIHQQGIFMNNASATNIETASLPIGNYIVGVNDAHGNFVGKSIFTKADH